MTHQALIRFYLLAEKTADLRKLCGVSVFLPFNLARCPPIPKEKIQHQNQQRTKYGNVFREKENRRKIRGANRPTGYHHTYNGKDDR